MNSIVDISNIDTIVSENILNQLKGWHLFSFKLWELKLSVNVNFKCTALHKISLNHCPHKECYQTCLYFVFLNVFVRVLNSVWHGVQTTNSVEKVVTCKHYEEDEHSKVTNYWSINCIHASNFVILAWELNIRHSNLGRVWWVFSFHVVIVNQLLSNKILHLHKRSSIWSPDTVFDMHSNHFLF